MRSMSASHTRYTANNQGRGSHILIQVNCTLKSISPSVLNSLAFIPNTLVMKDSGSCGASISVNLQESVSKSPYKEYSDNCEDDDRSALKHRFISACNSGFGFDDVCLLLFHVE